MTILFLSQITFCNYYLRTQKVSLNPFISHFSMFLRMIILWPAFLCWATRSPSPRTLKTFTRTTSSSCISSPTSIISEQRVNTRLRGTETRPTTPTHLRNVLWRVVRIHENRLSLPTGGWRSSAAPRSPPGTTACWTTKSPILTEFTRFHAPSPLGWHPLFLPPPTGLFAFLFYINPGHLYMCPCTFGAF